MSIPKFPENCSEITRECALDMILASIAMEELALSHIINAEGEKIQYVLGTLETGSIENSDIDEVLAINQSVACLLDSVSQNQMLLKSKMEKVLKALPCEDPKPIGPTGPTGPTGPIGPSGPACICKPRCSAAFKGDRDCKIWNAGCVLPWVDGSIQGKCACLDPCNNANILLASKGRFIVNFAANVKATTRRQCHTVINLQMCSEKHCSDIFTFKGHIPFTGEAVTVAMSGVIADVSNHSGMPHLSLKLVSPDSLMIENAMLNIIEI